MLQRFRAMKLFTASEVCFHGYNGGLSPAETALKFHVIRNRITQTCYGASFNRWMRIFFQPKFNDTPTIPDRTGMVWSRTRLRPKRNKQISIGQTGKVRDGTESWRVPWSSDLLISVNWLHLLTCGLQQIQKIIPSCLSNSHSNWSIMIQWRA